MKKRKKRLKSIGSVLLIMIICSILGFTIWIPGHATKDNAGNNPIAIMLDQGNGNYVESTSSSFTQDGYEFDHAQCQNGSIVTEKKMEYLLNLQVQTIVHCIIQKFQI